MPQQDLRDWMDRNSRQLFLSVITVAEIENGICRSRRAGAHAKAGRLADWLETLLHLYAYRVLAIDLAIARRIGVLMDHARGQARDPGLADMAIAATAVERGYTVLTRTVRHVAPLGVTVVDPYAAALPPRPRMVAIRPERQAGTYCRASAFHSYRSGADRPLSDNKILLAGVIACGAASMVEATDAASDLVSVDKPGLQFWYGGINRPDPVGPTGSAGRTLDGHQAPGSARPAGRTPG